MPTAKKLGELKAAGALDGPITLNDFGANIDADQLHLRLGELIREAIATDLKINSNAKPQMEKKAAETAARRPADADVIVKARSFVASADDESADRTLVALERELAESKERLQKLISLLADSGQPANVDTTRMRLLHLSQPKAESQVRGPTVVREDTEEKNRSDQVEDESGAQTLAAGGDAFETGDQRYRDLIKQMQMVVEKADKPAEANERAIPSGGGKKDEL